MYHIYFSNVFNITQYFLAYDVVLYTRCYTFVSTCLFISLAFPNINHHTPFPFSRCFCTCAILDVLQQHEVMIFPFCFPFYFVLLLCYIVALSSSFASPLNCAPIVHRNVCCPHTSPPSYLFFLLDFIYEFQNFSFCHVCERMQSTP